MSKVKLNRLLARPESWQLIVPALCYALGGAAVGLLLDPNRRSWPYAVATIALFVVAVFFHLQPIAQRRRFLNTLGKRPAGRREILVLPLSHTRDILPRNLDLSGRLADDLAALAEAKRQASLTGQPAQHWIWEQALRGIHHHTRDGGPLRRVILLGSPESVEQLHQFRNEVISRYDELKQVSFEAYYQYDGKIHVLDSPDHQHHRQNGVDFEDFDELTRAYDRILSGLERDGARPDQIQVDFTAGQKPASVVAAVVTICSDVSNQYVATNPRDRQAETWMYDVWGYDFWELRRPGD